MVESCFGLLGFPAQQGLGGRLAVYGSLDKAILLSAVEVGLWFRSSLRGARPDRSHTQKRDPTGMYSKAQDEEESRRHGLLDPSVYVVSGAPTVKGLTGA